MSPSPSDPYQSRLIRTVIRQTRQWFDRGQTTFRRVQVAASWSAQILLYPIYAFFQTSRVIGHKVGQTVQADRLEFGAETPNGDQISLQGQTSSLTSDRPIQKVLEAVDTLAIPGNIPVLTQSPAIKIRAIASLIEQKSLVLVTNHNQVLDVLTLEQQQILHKQIIVAIAVYARQVRARRLRPKWATQLLTGVRNFVQPLLPKQPSAGLARLLPMPEVEEPVQNALFEVRRLLRLTESPELPALPDASADLIIRKSRQPLPPVYIRGIVSLLPARSLALVTNENTVLDVLSPEQQQFIHQRITWEVAHYGRYIRLRSQATGLLTVHPPHQFSRLLAPIAGFQWLMTWMQSGAIALSTNLFREASQTTHPLPAVLPPTASTDPPSHPLHRLLKTVADLMPPQSENTGQPAKGSVKDTIIQRSMEQSHPMIERIDSAAYSYRETATVAPVEKLFRSIESSQTTDCVDIEVTLMGYEQSWLERVLHWLDRCFVWIEEWLRVIWNRCTGN